ncbi:hypothetical protein [Streptomyces sp. NPDC004065]|uniref:hypothetical protein n=1 Tax=Streptomyces sp. NPDC004065 TaxID=3364689 RepID=UPI00384D7A1E
MRALGERPEPELGGFNRSSQENWQLTRARALIEPAGGHVVAEYFDVGHSRSLPWQRRPRANELLQALRDPNRGFDAVVIGEPQRTFYGNQFGNTLRQRNEDRDH